MSLTRLELRKRARLRCGDPYKASETTRSGGRILDADLNDSINDAIHQVAKDAITTRGIPLLVKQQFIRVIAGKARYQLNADLLRIYGDRIFFRSSGTKYELFREDLGDVISGYDEDLTATIPEGFQLYPGSRYLITEGIATGGTATTLEDADRVDASTNAFDDGASVVDQESNALAAADIVENVTDNSEGAISAVTDHNTLTFATQTEDAGLKGGSRNDFRLGDHYRVWSREYTGEELWVSLPPSQTDEEVVVTSDDDDDTTERVVGTNASDQNVKQGQTFKLKRPRVISSISVYFGATSKGVLKDSPPLGNIVLRVETDSSGPSGTLVHFSAKASRTSIDEDGWNTFTFDRPFRGAENTTYGWTVEIEAQSTFYSDPTSVYYTVVQDDDANYTDGSRYEYISSWTASTTSDLLFKVNGSLGEESLEVPYVAKGRDLGGDTETMDLPDSALEAVMLWVEYDVIGKAPEGRGRRDRLEKYQLYEAEIAKLIKDLHRAHTPARRGVVDRVTPYAQSRRGLDPRFQTPLTWEE